ncbi:MAG TPA: rhodanese-like domain-containing protein [Thermoanaerobaculia bacterium]|nr:rhodanese-like domain-containing protein [Thermoanaerobaculia bacterium]
MSRTFTFIACVVLAWNALASPREALLVDAAWLKAHLNDPDLVLLHVGDKDAYTKQHIAGATLVAQQDVSVSEHTDKGLMLEMPPVDELRKRLEGLGISDKSRVVVYYGNDWISPSTRIVLTLDYAGLGARTSILDGGMPAWVKAGGAVTSEVRPVRKGTLAPLKTRPVVVDAEFVRTHRTKPGFKVIDGRAPVFYDGIETGGMHQKDKTGHIAGAGSVPFTSVVDDSGHWLSPADLRALFAKAGVKPSDTVIGYCHIGQQATAMLFAARTLGHKVVLYDGSFQDWSRHADSPVENPSAAKGGSR